MIEFDKGVAATVGCCLHGCALEEKTYVTVPPALADIDRFEQEALFGDAHGAKPDGGAVVIQGPHGRTTTTGEAHLQAAEQTTFNTSRRKPVAAAQCVVLLRPPALPVWIHMKRMMSLQLGIALIVALVVSPGCGGLIGPVKDSIGVVQQELVDADDILTRAIADLNADSRDWERILNKALEDLPKAERQIRADLEQLSQRAIAGAGLEVRCEASFVRDMLVDGLEAILAQVRRAPPPPRVPVVCNASPSVIDMNLPDNSRNNVEIYGYNLTQGGIKLFHVMHSAQQDSTAHFAAVSEFKRVINLGASGVAVVPDSVKLRIDLGTGAPIDIVVIQKWPDVCKVTKPHVDAATLEVYPKHTGKGDLDFEGHGPCIRARASVFISPDRARVMGRLFAKIWECPDDPTRIRWDYSDSAGAIERTLFTAPAGHEIVDIRSPLSASIEHIDSDHAPNDRKDAGLVLNWVMMGDTDGDDIGKSFVRASLAPLDLVVKQKIDCVTELDLARLQQQRAMSGEVQAWVQTNAPAVEQLAKDEQAKVDKRLSAAVARKKDPAKLDARRRLQEVVNAFEKRTHIKGPPPCQVKCDWEMDDRILNEHGGTVHGGVIDGPGKHGPVIDGPGKHGPVIDGPAHNKGGSVVGPSGIPSDHRPGSEGISPGGLVKPDRQ